MKSAARLLAIAGLCLAPSVHAETLYVIEQLIVNVNSAPDGTGERVASIRSGDPVELLEREGDQAHVRLRSGAEGWVKASYLSTDPPLRARLEERTQELAKASQELEKSRQRVEQLEAELSRARVAASAPPPAAEPGTAQPSPRSPVIPAESARPIFPDADRTGTRSVWRWAVGASFAGLFVGFALGWRTLDRRIRRKYGGLRIY